MRVIVSIVLIASLAGCSPPGQPFAIAAAVDFASIAVFKRGTFDLIYSGITGKDCSVVRLGEGKTYCRASEGKLPPAPVCTRSLGYVECWANPEALDHPSRLVVDGPQVLTAEQERNAAHRWPDL